MIDFETPKPIKEILNVVEAVAVNMMRPVSRYYDENEHEYPKELDILRPPSPKKPVEGAEKKGAVVKEEKKREKSKKPKYDNLIGVVNIEELCWGDLGLMLTIPGAGLGNAAIAAVGTPDQKAKFGSMWAAMAITEPEAGSEVVVTQSAAQLVETSEFLKVLAQLVADSIPLLQSFNQLAFQFFIGCQSPRSPQWNAEITELRPLSAYTSTSTPDS